MPSCPPCDCNARVTTSMRPEMGTHHCALHGWFTPGMSAEKPIDLPEKLRVATREINTEQDGRHSLEEFLTREYHYHMLRAEEIRDRLELNGIHVGGID
jgi:hypothetical protein